MRLYSDLDNESKTLQQILDFIYGKISFKDVMYYSMKDFEVRANKKQDYKKYIERIMR